jgi:hypothetical protein
VVRCAECQLELDGIDEIDVAELGTELEHEDEESEHRTRPEIVPRTYIPRVAVLGGDHAEEAHHYR